MELTDQYKISLSKDERIALNKDGLLETSKEGRRLVHQITDKGIAWCAGDLMDGEAPSRIGPLARVHALVLSRLARFAYQRGALAEAIQSGDLEELIRQVYLELGDGYQDWVRLAKIRPRLGGADRDEVDETLLRMVKAGTTHLVPDSNRKVLTEDDHAAAIRVGGEDKHLMAIEES
ncbi:hypothetical protein [Lentzea nigeriaca]|uniref:hypothetical protein n=1 Tax=Lentzea nigeriaca TaxID=1128665 RepID=UPI0027DE89A7|nr:hypothetical protein [Lentzea nigeriaca]MBM7862764.1 hypothetical protein [Lentzea nigeriaca]